MTESQKAMVRKIQSKLDAAYSHRPYGPHLEDIANLLSLIRQQEAEVQAMLGVVEAAQMWASFHRKDGEDVDFDSHTLRRAVAALRSQSEKQKEG